MTPLEATRLLYQVWGNPSVISQHDAERLSVVAEPQETLLETCARIAGIEVRYVMPFAYFHIRELCARREIELTRDGVR